MAAHSSGNHIVAEYLKQVHKYRGISRSAAISNHFLISPGLPGRSGLGADLPRGRRRPLRHPGTVLHHSGAKTQFRRPGTGDGSGFRRDVRYSQVVRVPLLQVFRNVHFNRSKPLLKIFYLELNSFVFVVTQKVRILEWMVHNLPVDYSPLGSSCRI